jgi:hypothetical protein
MTEEDFEGDFNENLINLFKKFKELRKNEDLEDLKIDFVFLIQEKISKIVDDNFD